MTVTVTDSLTVSTRPDVTGRIRPGNLGDYHGNEARNRGRWKGSGNRHRHYPGGHRQGRVIGERQNQGYRLDTWFYRHRPPQRQGDATVP